MLSPSVTWWSSADQVLGTAASTLIVYLGVLAAVRVAGRRTVSQLSAFDAVPTIALGSVLATTVLPSHVSIADGFSAAATLLLAQVIVGAVRQRWSWARRMVDFDAQVVVRRGDLSLQRGPTSAQA